MRMGLPNASDDLSSEMEVFAFRRLLPIRPDARPLRKARDTTIALGWPAEAAPVLSKQLSDTIKRHVNFVLQLVIATEIWILKSL
ncbi:hypothetical protein QYF36_023761 [Acer negundo]|nr:hypothetical protein QYF36_023761 [Acer negundo]